MKDLRTKQLQNTSPLSVGSAYGGSQSLGSPGSSCVYLVPLPASRPFPAPTHCSGSSHQLQYFLPPAMWLGLVFPNYCSWKSEGISFSSNIDDTYSVLGSSEYVQGRPVRGYYSEDQFHYFLREPYQHLLFGVLLAWGKVPASPRNPLYGCRAATFL